MPKNIAAIAINMRPTVIRVLLVCPRHPSFAVAARIQPAPPNDASRMTTVKIILLCGWATTPRIWIIASNRNIMIPTRRPDQRTAILVAMLKDAAINAQPTKYTQNMRPGMYRGTRSLTNCGPKRWRAPKTASGTAKHKLLRATTLSRPRAAVTSFLAAHAPIKKTAMPAAHIAVAVRDKLRKRVRTVACIDSPLRYRASDSTTRGQL